MTAPRRPGARFGGKSKKPAQIDTSVATVIDRPCPSCRQPSPHRLTDDLLSECLNCGARWL